MYLFRRGRGSSFAFHEFPCLDLSEQPREKSNIVLVLEQSEVSLGSNIAYEPGMTRAVLKGI